MFLVNSISVIRIMLFPSLKIGVVSLHMDYKRSYGCIPSLLLYGVTPLNQFGVLKAIILNRLWVFRLKLGVLWPFLILKILSLILLLSIIGCV